MNEMQENFNLNDRVIVITGASSGIGAATAVAAAHAGATVVAIGRSIEKLQRIKKQLQEISSRSHCIYSLDVTNYEYIPTLIEQIVFQCGKINGFVHCAGIFEAMPLKLLSAGYYEHLYMVNVVSGFEFVKNIINKKNAGEPLSVVLVSSIVAEKGEAGLLAYSASKGALLSGMRSLACELAKRRIRVNCVLPGNLQDTAMWKHLTMGVSEDAIMNLNKQYLLGPGKVSYVSAPIIFLLSDAAKWITGVALKIDGGYSL